MPLSHRLSRRPHPEPAAPKWRVARTCGARIFEVRKRDTTHSRPDGHAMRPLSDAALFVIFRSVGGAIRAAVLEESPLLETQAFEDELVRLAIGVLRA